MATETLASLPRELIAVLAQGNPRVRAALENTGQQVEETVKTTETQAAATQALQDATVLVLSSNEALTNERIFRPGVGFNATDNGSYLTVDANEQLPLVEGGFQVRFYVTNPANLALPLSGTLVSRTSVDTLSNKTLNAPKVTGVNDYADDAAAATGGVPVGGLYRTGSIVKLRVA